MSPEVTTATNRVLSASLRALYLERQEPPHAADRQLAFDGLAKACRALTVAVSLLPWADRPVGWDEDLGKAAFPVDTDSEAVR